MDADAVLSAWVDRSGEFGPGYYAYRGADETSEALEALVADHAGPSPSVLEVGCSSGRHLAHLLAEGYDDLHGVEVNEGARAVMEETYPDLAATGHFRFAPVEDVVGEFAEGQFDVVYSVQTLQHLHPDSAWVFDELARATGDLLVTVEMEGEADKGDADDATDGTAATASGVSYENGQFPLYYRDWRAVFEGAGLAQVATRSLGAATLRAFRA